MPGDLKVRSSRISRSRRRAAVVSLATLVVGGGLLVQPGSAAAVGDRAGSAGPVVGQLAYIAVPGTFGTSNALAVVDTRTNSIVDYRNLPEYLSDIAVDPDGTQVYAVAHGEVVVIDPATDATLGTIAVGGTNNSVVFSPSGAQAYVSASDGSGSVSVIDVATRTVTATIPAGGWRLAVSPDGSRLYATGTVGGVLSVIDTSTNTVVDTVSCGSGSGSVAATADGSDVYVADTDTRVLYDVDVPTDTVTGTVNLNPNSIPTAVVVNPGSTTAYVEGGPVGQTYVVDLQSHTVTGSYRSGLGAAEALNADGSRLFAVADSEMTPYSALQAFDTGTGATLGAVRLLGEPDGVAMGPTAPGTATLLRVSPSGTARHGTAVKVTATVSGATTGTVQFYDSTSSANEVPLGAPVPVKNGTAVLTTSALSVDAHTLSAAFTPAPPGLLRSASAQATLVIS
jgi:YVTN family beta-propeller protein